MTIGSNAFFREIAPILEEWSMPEWEIHDRWAEKLGISKEISNYVNSLIGFPERHQEFMEFCDNEDKTVYR